jgi:hypothetical protein
MRENDKITAKKRRTNGGVKGDLDGIRIAEYAASDRLVDLSQVVDE